MTTAAPWSKAPKKQPKPRVLRPINHGTEAGYSAHRRRGEEACAACKAGHSKASAAGREGKPRKYKVAVPLAIFAELYWTATPKAQAMLDRHFGDKRVDDLIKRAEEES
ncbi:hypothetical protein SEA_GUYFAGIERI_71 [Rhodococcus phage GuyFagieri]|nr:hypothetical protein SEA_GUYFAGIERI_71 [Rhodococcus phage GuyFagieri]